MTKKVFIGVGHGGADPGAVARMPGQANIDGSDSGAIIRESDLNLAIALSCCTQLRRHGVDVRMSRTTDEDDTLAQEIRECNEYAPDLAIDIHNNAGGGDGVEAYYYSGGGLSKTLADNVLEEIVKIGQNSRGAKTRMWGAVDYYGFIRETYAPAVIVECAFVDNAADMEIIDTEAERARMGAAIARGILRTLDIEYIPGDVNGDGRINLTDVSAIMRHIAGHDVEIDTVAADANGDGRVSLTDAAALLKRIAERK